jgi:hypothetical protein
MVDTDAPRSAAWAAKLARSGSHVQHVVRLTDLNSAEHGLAHLRSHAAKPLLGGRQTSPSSQPRARSHGMGSGRPQTSQTFRR